jgi:predicted phosphodiesterase
MSRLNRHAPARSLALAISITALASCSSDRSPIQGITSALITTGPLDADAYVRSKKPTTNFGTETTIRADSADAGSVLQGFVRFTIGNVGTIASATLRVFVTDGSGGPITVQKVSNNSWGETTINWSNKPAADGPVVATLGATASSSWVDIDITSVAQPNSTISLAFLPGTSDSFTFSSREAATNPPQVIIDDGVGGTGGTGGGTGGSGGTGGTGGGGPSTDPNLKIAFVGDTADGSSYAAVISLALAEGAQAIVTAGDMTYDSDPNGWWATTEAGVGQSYPVFLARGNHDDTSWTGFLPEAANHLGGATRIAGPHDAAYKTIFRGLDIVTIRKGDAATTITNLFGSDSHVWKVCNWHQNQNKMQVGGKGDEMGWAVYEACRQKGAIIITGHEHTYHRTKTMTNTEFQTIDPTCSGGASVCVGPGRTIVSVVGTGGTGLRSQVRCTPTSATPPFPSLNTSDPSCPIWASIYTTNQGVNFGAQFITFNVDGNPKKARSYFKTISGTTIDTFDIFAD